jgi:o-succinylbenzoate synthase
LIERIEVFDAAVAARPSVRLRILASDGHAGVGEASPLPGYSPDDAASCRAALLALEPNELSQVEPCRAGDLISPFLPAARFALETALLDLHARRGRQPAWKLLADASDLNAEQADPVPLGMLLPSGDADRTVEAASVAVAEGYRTLKLKVGREPFVRELAVARRVREAVGGDVALRFDANRAWSVAAARAHLEALFELQPELVEEPTADLEALGSAPVPIALDESLQDPRALERLRPLLGPCRVCAVVLKPTALGGLGHCLDLARRARRLGLDVTVSHTFEGPIAFAACWALALAAASRSRASGLAPHTHLEGSTLPGNSQGTLRPWRSSGLALTV